MYTGICTLPAHIPLGSLCNNLLYTSDRLFSCLVTPLWLNSSNQVSLMKLYKWHVLQSRAVWSLNCRQQTPHSADQSRCKCARRQCESNCTNYMFLREVPMTQLMIYCTQSTHDTSSNITAERDALITCPLLKPAITQTSLYRRCAELLQVWILNLYAPQRDIRAANADILHLIPV